MTVSWSWAIEMYLSGSWVDVSADVLRRDPIEGDEGINGIGPNYHIAGSGSLSFYLDNGESNSAGLLGYYAPGHTNCRTGFARGAAVRVKFTYGARIEYFKYYITMINATPGQFRERKTHVVAADYMYKLSLMKLKGVNVQVNQRPDQVVDTVIGSLAEPPEIESYQTEPFTTFEYALHGEKDEKSTIMNVLTKVVSSSGGYIFKKSDATKGETLVYEHRLARYDRAVLAAFDNDMSSISVEWNDEDVIDGVRLTYNPGRVDETDVVLGSIPDEITLAAGETRKIELRLRDPNGLATRVSAISYADLVAGTDYKFSSVSGDGGSDLNASLGITPNTDSSNVFSAIVANNSSVTGYLNLFQKRGKAIYLYESLDVLAGVDTPVNELSYEMPYVANYYVAVSFCDMLETRGSDTTSPRVGEVGFYADASDTMMGWFLDGVPGQPFTTTETATGLSTKKFFIQFRKFKIHKGILWVEWLGEPAETITYLHLDTVGETLDSTYVLA